MNVRYNRLHRSLSDKNLGESCAFQNGRHSLTLHDQAVRHRRRHQLSGFLKINQFLATNLIRKRLIFNALTDGIDEIWWACYADGRNVVHTQWRVKKEILYE